MEQEEIIATLESSIQNKDKWLTLINNKIASLDTEDKLEMRLALEDIRWYAIKAQNNKDFESECHLV